MFVRLTRRKRAKAGWLIALTYLLCVLAPAAAPAFGVSAPWLSDEIKLAAASEMHHGSNHEHGGLAVTHDADNSGANHKHDGKTSPGPCCAMLCLSAIPADLPEVAKPSQPISACVSEAYQRLPSESPHLLYRPPIA
jgi:hypothetical protein